MRVVLPIAAIVAILITAGAVSGGSKLTDRAPVDLEPGAPVAASVPLREAAYPGAFDPFTGWGVFDLQHGVTGRAAAPPAIVEVDPFDRYGVEAPSVPLVRAVPGPWDWRSFAEVRAQYADPGADALPGADTGPAVTGAWWETAPLDAK